MVNVQCRSEDFREGTLKFDIPYSTFEFGFDCGRRPVLVEERSISRDEKKS
jgi:hypothetical protein